MSDLKTKSKTLQKLTAVKHEKQIELDLLRTFPGNKHFTVGVKKNISACHSSSLLIKSFLIEGHGPCDFETAADFNSFCAPQSECWLLPGLQLFGRLCASVPF